MLALILLLFVLSKQNWQQIGLAFGRIEHWRFLVVLILTVLSRLAISLRWYVLLHFADQRVTIQKSLLLTFAGLFGSNFLPTTIGGDFIRLVGAVQMKMSATVVTVSLVADRLVGMAGMAVLLPVGILRIIKINVQELWAPSGIVMAFSTTWIARRGSWLKSRVVSIFKQMWSDLALWMHHPQALAFALIFTWLHMICLFTTIWLLLDGMHEKVGWIQVAVIWSLVYFITLLPVTINGYGLQEISATILYAKLGGISTESSVTIALLVRSLHMLISLPGALFVPGIIGRLRKGTNSPGEKHEEKEDRGG